MCADSTETGFHEASVCKMLGIDCSTYVDQLFHLPKPAVAASSTLAKDYGTPMNWEAIGAVGEIVGAGAVVVSLAYLAIQIKAQNREARVASAHEIFEAFRNIALPFQNPDHAALMSKSANEGYRNLSEQERVQVIAIVVPMMRVWEEAYYQHRSERLDASIWSSISSQYIDMLSLDTFQEVWRLRRHIFSEEFRRYVDSVEVGSYRNI